MGHRYLLGIWQTFSHAGTCTHTDIFLLYKLSVLAIYPGTCPFEKLAYPSYHIVEVAESKVSQLETTIEKKLLVEHVLCNFPSPGHKYLLFSKPERGGGLGRINKAYTSARVTKKNVWLNKDDCFKGNGEKMSKVFRNCAKEIKL